MKKIWHNLIALTLCAICLFGTACSNGKGDGSATGSGSAAPVEPDGYYVTEFTVLTPPTKTSYAVGEKFDYTGMVLKAVWNDGEVEEIGAYECDEILPKGALTKDVTQMTFKYYGKETTQAITVEEVTVLGLTIDTSKIYTRVAADSFVNLNDIVVTVNYSGDRSEVVTDYEITENGEEIKTPARYQVTLGEHVISVKYLDVTKTFTVTGFIGTKYQFNENSVTGDLEEATADNPLFVEPANIVKNFGTPQGWVETTSVSYNASKTEGITDVKPHAIIKIHFYSDKATYARFSMNAATYYLTRPDKGDISPMELNKTFSSITLNGFDAPVSQDVLPGGKDWQRVFADVNLTEGWVRKGDNVLTLIVDEFYWTRNGNQLYGESEISIKSITMEHVDGVDPLVDSIKVTKNPTKTHYAIGESFDPTGMEVTAYYNDASNKVVTDYVYATGALKASDIEVLVTYEGKSTTVAITVEHEHASDGAWIQTDKEHYKLCSVCGQQELLRGNHVLSKQWTFVAPTKTNYSKGEKLDLTGMNLTATCSTCGEIDATSKVTLSSDVAPEPDSNGKAVITVTYGEVVKTFEINLVRIEIVAGWDGASTPSGGHTTSFFVNKDGVSGLGIYNMNQDYCGGFKQGAKMLFYVYSEKTSNAKLSFRAACGNWEVQANNFFTMKHYKLSSETQSLTEATAVNIAIDDSIRFGYSMPGDNWQVPWFDFDDEFTAGTINLQQGWNVIEVEFIQGHDINFKSIVIDYLQ